MRLDMSATFLATICEAVPNSAPQEFQTTMHTSKTRVFPASWLLGLSLASAACLSGLGCSDDSVPIKDDGKRADSAVVVAIYTRSADSLAQIYLHASAELPQGKLDLDNSLELPDAVVVGNGEAIFIGNNERISFQRYEVNEDYTFTMVGEFSLQNYGVDYINNDPLFFSATRAFYVDATRGQIIVFNPTTMEITGDIQVPEILREDYYVWMGSPLKVGDRYMATLLYTDETWTATAPDTTIGVLIGDNEEEPIVMMRDERGVGAYLGIVGEDEHFYVSADGLSGNLALAELQDVPSPRVLRVKENEDEVDPDFMIDLGELLDTPATFGFWPVAGNAFVTQAWASDVDPKDVLEPGEGGWGTPYYDWMFVDIDTMQAKPVKGLDRSAPYNTLRFMLDGESYVQRFVEDISRAELYHLKEDGSAKKVAETTVGDFWFLGRITAPIP